MKTLEELSTLAARLAAATGELEAIHSTLMSISLASRGGRQARVQAAVELCHAIDKRLRVAARDLVAAEKAERLQAEHEAGIGIEILSEGTPLRCTLADFCRDNADDEETCDAARSLNVGCTYAGGGGAAPAFTIRRVS